MIYGDRIRQAREYCGLTQTELAKRIGVNQSAIAHLESGRNIPTEDLLTAIAEHTGFMPPFFFKEPTNDFPTGTLALRARNSLTTREFNKAYQYATVNRPVIEHQLEHQHHAVLWPGRPGESARSETSAAVR